jgi:hypothetical protein
LEKDDVILIVHGYKVFLLQRGETTTQILGHEGEAVAQKVAKLCLKARGKIWIILPQGWDPGKPQGQLEPHSTTMRNRLQEFGISDESIITTQGDAYHTAGEIEAADATIRALGLTGKIVPVCMWDRAPGIVWHNLWHGRTVFPTTAFSWKSFLTFQWVTELFFRLPLRILDPLGRAPWTKRVKKKRGG